MSTVRDELLKVRADYGDLTPANVVDAARDESSPLHSRFEWDDSRAAELYRLDQAADLIRSVKVRYSSDESGPKDVRAFVVTRRPEAKARSVYEPVEEVLADDFQRELLLRDCRREWALFEQKYRHLEEFAAIVGRAAVAA